jgi:hypothetical protein
MKASKTVLTLTALLLACTLNFSSCNSSGQEESSEPPVSTAESSKSASSSKSSTASSKSNASSDNVSLPPIGEQKTEYLSVIGCTLTDKNHFVIVGKCEEDAIITATTGNQNVTSPADKGFFSVRLDKESTPTRVTLEAKGKITEKYIYDAKPKYITPSNDMWPIVGGNNYNFFFQKMMPDFMQTNTLSDQQLTNLTDKMKNRVNALKEASPGTEIIYMIVPSKASIYPELVPEQYEKGTGKSRLEQVNEALKAGGATVINLLDTFNQHKNDEHKLYWKTDSHWTDYGAFVAYTELFNYISKKYPDAAPRKMTDFDFKGDYYEGGDMIFYMAMNQKTAMEYCWLRTPKFDMDSKIAGTSRYRSPTYLMYSDDIVPEMTFSTGNKNLPNLYVMRDSYSAQIFDILAERANTTVYKQMWGYTYNIGDIKSAKPDYIIYIAAKWNINSIIQG